MGEKPAPTTLIWDRRIEENLKWQASTTNSRFAFVIGRRLCWIQLQRFWDFGFCRFRLWFLWCLRWSVCGDTGRTLFGCKCILRFLSEVVGWVGN